MLVTADKPPGQRRQKRAYRSAYNMPDVPRCETHKVLMVVYCTEQVGGGMVRQYRKCPFCTEHGKSIYRLESEAITSPPPSLFDDLD